jgi:uncharacterized protein (DUF488 family)
MGVDLLVDVRERAWSQRPEFRKAALKSALESAGLMYYHFKEAGNPFRPRQGEVKSFASCAESYRFLLASSPQILADALELVTGADVAFFCYEAASTACHRSVLVEELRRLEPSLEVEHL